MSFEDPVFKEDEEKEISSYKEAFEYLKKTDKGEVKSERFQNFVEREEGKVKNHIQALELAFRLAVLYFMAGSKDYALESLNEIEEAEDYITEETDLFKRVRDAKGKMKANEKIEINFFNE